MALRRTFVKGGYYHVYIRGNHRERIYYNTDDYLHFLMRLGEYAKACDITVLAYCLMTNHYHLLVRQNSEISVTSLMRRLNISYAKHFNWQYGQVGHVYQGRFGDRQIISGDDLANVARYIHRNPARMDNIFNYRWSDVRKHTSSASTPLLETISMTGYQYAEFVSSEINIEVAQATSELTALQSNRS